MKNTIKLTALMLFAVLANCVSAQTALEQRLFELINIERVKQNRDPVERIDTFDSVARAHSEDMLRNNFLGEKGSDGSMAAQWFEKTALADDVIGGATTALAYRGNNTPEQMIASWMNNTTSRSRLHSANCIGISIVPTPAGSSDRNAAYWTVIIGGLPNDHPLILGPKPKYANIPMASVSSRHDYTLAVRSDGTLWAWGGNSSGELGLGYGTSRERFFPVQAAGDNWVSVNTAIQSVSSFGIKRDGTLWAWGSNYLGKLGDGTNENRWSPVQVGSDRNWKSVSAGSHHTVAVKTDGSLWAWGDGMGTLVDSYVPIRIGTDGNWADVSASSEFSVGLKTDGTLWGWGYFQVLNSRKQWITVWKRDTPVQIGSDRNWAFVTAALNTVFAIKTDGTLWGFGDNVLGQLGIGSNDDNKTAPVQVGTDRNWAFVANGNLHTVAIKTDGTLWAWGNNELGQLGNGTTSKRNPVPVQIGTDRDWKSVSCGKDFTVAIKTDGTVWSWGNGYSLGDVAPMESRDTGPGYSETYRSSPARVMP